MSAPYAGSTESNPATGSSGAAESVAGGGWNPQASPMTPQALDQMYWSFTPGDPSSYTFYQTLGLALCAVITMSTWTNTFRYFQTFGKSDNALLQSCIAFGFLLTSAQLFLQVYHREDGIIGFSQALISSIFAFFGVVYYTHKIYTLSGRR
ncbi:hypothetical protein BD324DRAFT_343660 [Kockovaella imperatae]|uniref:Uncharacterized protein n=1 Tax=Kockovaella imperatae TaxID=4999 RepID=A0A1Y1UL70_9TREE|nr:hypothetical protein BD324DRAFT_343660 [Kockovaella imperatae]ORX38226.1 hypothetical protein BD324DRAFT_343660 [Kockovaella imperatae]